MSPYTTVSADIDVGDLALADNVGQRVGLCVRLFSLTL